MAGPEAVDARKNGFHPFVFSWIPRAGDVRHFYFVELDQKERESTPLGSGLIGHFAVNRRSGELVSMDSVQVEHYPSLEGLQKTFRRQHCVSAAIVSAESDRFPEQPSKHPGLPRHDVGLPDR